MLVCSKDGFGGRCAAFGAPARAWLEADAPECEERGPLVYSKEGGRDGRVIPRPGASSAYDN